MGWRREHHLKRGTYNLWTSIHDTHVWLEEFTMALTPLASNLPHSTHHIFCLEPRFISYSTQCTIYSNIFQIHPFFITHFPNSSPDIDFHDSPRTTVSIDHRDQSRRPWFLPINSPLTIPSGKHTKNYWKLWFSIVIVDLRIKHGDFP